jgi:branched-subunit amino acid ABC-type transport system permease component
MSSPSMMINFALGAFLTGIGIYLGFVWQNNLDTLAGKTDSRNIFVCFLVSLVFVTLFMVSLRSRNFWRTIKSPLETMWREL